MKATALLAIGIACFTLLTGCATPHHGCSIQHPCKPTYLKKSRCGICVINRCAQLCDSCTYNEPQCDACWSCVKEDGGCSDDSRCPS